MELGFAAGIAPGALFLLQTHSCKVVLPDGSAPAACQCRSLTQVVIRLTLRPGFSRRSRVRAAGALRASNVLFRSQPYLAQIPLHDARDCRESGLVFSMVASQRRMGDGDWCNASIYDISGPLGDSSLSRLTCRGSGMSSYDEIPYHSFPFSQTHPIRLATIGRLFGMQAAEVDRCRVLELGCAAGGNLLPMAESYPRSEFVGVDASARELDDGRSAVAAMNLSNVTLHHKDILQVDQSIGKFDYLIAHGVYSWVPPGVQTKILRLCSELLNESGIAYISYNTLPGWHMRGMVRDVMCYRAQFFEKPEDRLHEARELVNFLASSVRREGNAFGLLLNDELRLLQEKEDYYLLHEFLEDVNQPCYFHEFMEKATAHDLQYLGEADFSIMSLSNFSREIVKRLQEISSDIIQTEQYMDFVRNRMFRQTLLCRKELTLDRSLKAERVFDLYVSSSSEPESPLAKIDSRDRVTFRRPGSTLTTSEPLVKAAIVVLRENWPLAVHFPDLLDRARAKLNADPLVVESDRDRQDMYTLAEPLLRCFATTHVELAVAPTWPELRAAEFPRTTRLARWQAGQSNRLTNLWHKSTVVSDLQRHIVKHLDGCHDRAALIESAAEAVTKQSLVLREHGQAVKDPARVREILAEMLEGNLQDLAMKGLLMRDQSV